MKNSDTRKWNAVRSGIAIFFLLSLLFLKVSYAQSPITFTVEVTNPACPGGEGTIAFTNVSGGVKPYKFTIYHVDQIICECGLDDCLPQFKDLGDGVGYECVACRCYVIPFENVQPVFNSMVGDIVCKVRDSIGNEVSDTVTVTDPPAITINVTPSGNVKGCKGTQLTLTANTDAAVSQFDWLKDGLVIPGQHQITLMVGEDGNYASKITDITGCSETSAGTKVTFKKLPKATIIQQPCQNGAVKLQATEGANYMYKWKKGNKFIDGATLNTYIATVDAKYKVEVTNSTGCSKLSGPSEVIISCRQGELAAEHKLTAVSLYPNPNGGNFSIDLTLSDAVDQEATIVIVNMLGQSIYEEQVMLTGGHIKKDVNLDHALADGIYQVQVLVNEEIYTEKVILQRK